MYVQYKLHFEAMVNIHSFGVGFVKKGITLPLKYSQSQFTGIMIFKSKCKCEQDILKQKDSARYKEQ